MGIFEGIYLDDRVPRNIRFMRIRVKIDPWAPLLTSFMLRLDDGAYVWVQYRYERVHKICKRCGLIGHTRGQCSQNLEEVETSLYMQRMRIQRLHQVHFRFDTLEPLFSNDLKAFYNPRRGWTSQMRFGPNHLSHHHHHNAPNPHAHSSSDSTSHASHHPYYPDSNTTPLPRAYNDTDNLAPNHTKTKHASLHSAINSLHLNSQIPIDPLNSPASETEHDHHLGTFSTRPSWLPPSDSKLKWVWVNDRGPYLTNGELQNSQTGVSDSESDSVTVTMFNLDRLNEARLEVRNVSTWERG